MINNKEFEVRCVEISKKFNQAAGEISIYTARQARALVDKLFQDTHDDVNCHGCRDCLD